MKRSYDSISLDVGYTFEDVFRLYYKRVRFFAYQMLHDIDLAEDVVQEAFIVYWKERKGLSTHDKVVKSFLYSTVKFIALRHIRHQIVIESHFLNSPFSDLQEEQITENMIRAEVVKEIHVALGALPKSCREIFRLGYFEGYTNSKIADVLDISINTVKTQKRRGFKIFIWLKYHKGTARVPGGPGWPGANQAYLNDFSIDIDAEVAFFLKEAMESARIVADQVPLYNDYPSMFNSVSLTAVPEVLLWRQYNSNLTPTVNHFTVGYIQRNGGGNSGFTRSMVESFLMENGLPVYAGQSGYRGDENYEDVFFERDPRLGFNVLKTGDLLTTNAVLTEYIADGNKGFFYRPPLTASDENRSTTGYSVKKGLSTDPAQGPTLPSVTASVVFRAAEAYLNYMEADYELDGALDNNSDKYWKAIRERAGMNTDYNLTVQATDLSQELDLARYSGPTLVSPMLYNIRRERRIEFAAEGLRFRDLKRWRALDQMKQYIVQGFDLWSEHYLMYSHPANNLTKIELKERGQANPNVSSKADSKYLLPFRINPNNLAFNGYNWNQNKYLEPIAFDHFRLTTEEPGSSDYLSSSIYQNPGWKIETSSLPEGD